MTAHPARSCQCGAVGFQLRCQTQLQRIAGSLAAGSAALRPLCSQCPGLADGGLPADSMDRGAERAQAGLERWPCCPLAIALLVRVLLSLLSNALLCALLGDTSLVPCSGLGAAGRGVQEGPEPQIRNSRAGGRERPEGAGFGVLPEPLCGAWGRKVLSPAGQERARVQGRLVVLSFLAFWRHC